jgi:hypothetical protein
MRAKNILLSAIVAGGAVGPAAIYNASIMEDQCEGQLRAGCQGLPPAQPHVDEREPSHPLPLYGAHNVVMTTGTALRDYTLTAEAGELVLTGYPPTVTVS